MPTLSRKELYDLVWSTPMSKLALTFGLSDVGLTKICDRHRVPTPPRGYWAKKEAGKQVKQTIFVEVDDPVLNSIKITSSTDRLPEPVREVLEQRRTERKITPSPKPTAAPQPITENLTDPHESIRATVKALRGSKASKGGIAEAIGPGLCGISVDEQSVERLVTILDRLARGCDSRGLTFAPADTQMSVASGPDKLTFEIKEKTNKVPHVLTAAELAAEARRKLRDERSARGLRSNWEYIPTPPEFDRVRSGDFGLEIHGWSDGLRRSWNDGRMQRLEALIDGILDGFEAQLVSIKLRREKWAKEEAERQDLQRRRDLAKARREREGQRKSLLNKIVRSERQAAYLQSWLASQAATGSTTPDPDLDRLIGWTRDHLHALNRFLDPLRLADELRARNLFPEPDELHDPLGEPPPERRWW